MKYEVREKENKGLPLACDCCNSKLTYHMEKYKSIIIGEIILDLHKDCYESFIETLKRLP